MLTKLPDFDEPVAAEPKNAVYIVVPPLIVGVYVSAANVDETALIRLLLYAVKVVPLFDTVHPSTILIVHFAESEETLKTR